MIKVKWTDNFSLREDGLADNWVETKWLNLSQIKGPEYKEYYTKVKVLYSNTGIYFLFECGDRILHVTFHQDFKELWKQDVVEVFLWPEEATSNYFEYELSPLNYELPLLISDRRAERAKWIPFQYHGSSRQVRHKISVEGGKGKSGASVKQWMAKIFIPYKLLNPLNNIPPKSGTTWRANLYRIDYDSKGPAWWAWQPIDKSFHEYKKFGTFIFK